MDQSEKAKKLQQAKLAMQARQTRHQQRQLGQQQQPGASPVRPPQSAVAATGSGPSSPQIAPPPKAAGVRPPPPPPPQAAAARPPPPPPSAQSAAQSTAVGSPPISSPHYTPADASHPPPPPPPAGGAGAGAPRRARYAQFVVGGSGPAGSPQQQQQSPQMGRPPPPPMARPPPPPSSQHSAGQPGPPPRSPTTSTSEQQQQQQHTSPSIGTVFRGTSTMPVRPPRPPPPPSQQAATTQVSTSAASSPSIASPSQPTPPSRASGSAFTKVGSQPKPAPAVVTAAPEPNVFNTAVTAGDDFFNTSIAPQQQQQQQQQQHQQQHQQQQQTQDPFADLFGSAPSEPFVTSEATFFDQQPAVSNAIEQPEPAIEQVDLRADEQLPPAEEPVPVPVPESEPEAEPVAAITAQQHEPAATVADAPLPVEEPVATIEPSEVVEPVSASEPIAEPTAQSEPVDFFGGNDVAETGGDMGGFFDGVETTEFTFDAVSTEFSLATHETAVAPIVEEVQPPVVEEEEELSAEVVESSIQPVSLGPDASQTASSATVIHEPHIYQTEPAPFSFGGGNAAGGDDNLDDLFGPSSSGDAFFTGTTNNDASAAYDFGASSAFDYTHHHHHHDQQQQQQQLEHVYAQPSDLSFATCSAQFPMPLPDTHFDQTVEEYAAATTTFADELIGDVNVEETPATVPLSDEPIMTTTATTDAARTAATAAAGEHKETEQTTTTTSKSEVGFIPSFMESKMGQSASLAMGWLSKVAQPLIMEDVDDSEQPTSQPPHMPQPHHYEFNSTDGSATQQQHQQNQQQQQQQQQELDTDGTVERSIEPQLQGDNVLLEENGAFLLQSDDSQLQIPHAEIADLTAQLGEAHVQLSEMDYELNTTKNNYTNLEQQYNHLLSNYNQLSSQYEATKNGHQQSLHQKDSEIALLKEQVRQLNEHRNSQSTAQPDNSAEIHSLNETLSNLQFQLQLSADEQTALLSDIDARKQSESILQNRVNELTEEVKRLQTHSARPTTPAAASIRSPMLGSISSLSDADVRQLKRDKAKLEVKLHSTRNELADAQVTLQRYLAQFGPLVDDDAESNAVENEVNGAEYQQPAQQQQYQQQQQQQQHYQAETAATQFATQTSPRHDHVQPAVLSFDAKTHDIPSTAAHATTAAPPVQSAFSPPPPQPPQQQQPASNLYDNVHHAHDHDHSHEHHHDHTAAPSVNEIVREKALHQFEHHDNVHHGAARTSAASQHQHAASTVSKPALGAQLYHCSVCFEAPILNI